MRKLSFIAPALFALLLFAAPQQVDAQTSIEVGPRLGIDLGDASDIGGDFFIGAEGRIGTDALPVIINPSFDYYFVDSPEGVDRSLIAIDINALYEFGIDNQAFTPYAGGGIGITRVSVSSEGVDVPGFGSLGGGSSSSSEVGLNLIGGARFETGSLQPFAQAKINVGSDITLFNLMGGLLFSF